MGENATDDGGLTGMRFSVPASVIEQIEKATITALLGNADQWSEYAYAERHATSGSLLDQVGAPRAGIPSAEVLVGFSLLSYGDAMHASARLWAGLEQRTLPIAQGTLLRQAIQAAAWATWLCTPEDLGESRRRFGLAAVKAIEGEKTAFTSLSRHAPLQEAREDAQRLLNKSDEDIALIRSHYDLGEQRPPSDTAVWEAAAEQVYPDDDRDQLHMKLAWRLLSGDAHSLVWVPLVRARARGERPKPSNHNPEALTTRVALTDQELRAIAQQAHDAGRTAMILADRRGLTDAIAGES